MMYIKNRVLTIGFIAISLFANHTEKREKVSRIPESPFLEKHIEQHKGVPLEQKVSAVHNPYYTTPYINNGRYPSKIEWDEGKPIIATSKYLMDLLGDNLLGVCWKYSGVIQWREGLGGENEEKTKRHEKVHRKFPMWHERKVREESNTLEMYIHPMTSYMQ